jgi:hypothetical protein
MDDRLRGSLFPPDLVMQNQQRVHEQQLLARLEKGRNLEREMKRARLRQIERQRDQLFGSESWKELQVTDEQ